MKIKASELTSPALDWAVAKCEGMSDDMLNDFDEGDWIYSGSRRYSTNWAQGGPIIEREKIELSRSPNNGSITWFANGSTFGCDELGPTPLIAAMRCFCCSKLGDVVDIPEELCQQQSS